MSHLEFTFAAKKNQSKVVYRPGFPGVKLLRMPKGRLAGRSGVGGVGRT